MWPKLSVYLWSHSNALHPIAVAFTTPCLPQLPFSLHLSPTLCLHPPDWVHLSVTPYLLESPQVPLNRKHITSRPTSNEVLKTELLPPSSSACRCLMQHEKDGTYLVSYSYCLPLS